MTKSKRARMSAQQRREQLLDVGRAVFAERGYDAASIEEIAHQAKISKPVVYEHFGGKEGLYAVVVDREVQALLTRIGGALAADRPRSMLEHTALAFLSYIEDQTEGFRVLVRDAPVAGTTGTLPSLIGDIASHVDGIFVGEFKQRGFDVKLAPIYSRALVGMVALVGEWWLDAGSPPKKDVAAHLVNLAWNGLRDLERKPTLSFGE